MDKKDFQIEELKSMQLYPKLYLSKYFSDLKRDVNLVFELKLDKNYEFLEIINTIDLIENTTINKIKPFDTFNKDIQSIEGQQNDLNSLIIIDEIKYEIERILFSNKSILFMNNYKNNTFLLIIKDEYLRKINSNDNNRYFNRENLIEYFLKEKLNKIDINNLNILSLHIEIMLKTSVCIMIKKIEYIDTHTFKDLTNLNYINFSNNQIDKIHQSTFKGLKNLKEIIFSYNKIKCIHYETFNGLINLNRINFESNLLDEIHPSLFKGLTNLKEIILSFNKIKSIHYETFNGLINLNRLNLESNQLEKINPSLFKDLSNLEYIHLNNNSIKELYTNLFDGLNNIKKIWFNDNDDLNVVNVSNK